MYNSLELFGMKYIIALLVMIMVLSPSVIIYSPQAEIISDSTPSEIKRNRSGPQTYEDEMGGWWLQDEGEDFEGGNLYHVSVNGAVSLDWKALSPAQWYWTCVNPVDSPSARSGHSMVYDSTNDRVILFGGYTENGKVGDTWIFDTLNGTWTEIQVSGPVPRYESAMAYDPVLKKVVLYGGQDGYQDTWLFDTASSKWMRTAETGAPSGRTGHAMTFDGTENKVVLYGGKDRHQTFTYDNSTATWKPEAYGLPGERRYHKMVYDSKIEKIITFGGSDGSYTKDDTWYFNTSNSTWLDFEAFGPSKRDRHGMAYDEVNELMVMHGGRNNQEIYSDTWTFNSDSETWSQLNIPGPTSRYWHSIVYDSQNKKMVLFGGGIQLGPSYLKTDETWILSTAERFSEGSYTSPIITLPEGHQWNDLTIQATEPNGTKFTVSVMNADTGLYMADYRDMEPRGIDLSGLEATSIKLRAHFETDGEKTPVLDSWNVTWRKKITEPIYYGGIPPVINVFEDAPAANILDLSDYFGEVRRSALTYEIEYVSNVDNVTIVTNNTNLEIQYLEENWTGKVDVIVNCSNVYGQTASSDKFSIIVQQVDDPPAWVTHPPSITMDEDNVLITNYSYYDYLIDAEDDVLELTSVSEDVSINTEIDAEGYLTITSDLDYFGASTVVITASQRFNPSMKISAIIPLTVDPVNDPPSIVLLSPGNNAVLNTTNLTLSWKGSDVDNNADDLVYNLYFDKNPDPQFSNSDLYETTFIMNDLDDKSTYYWYVKANDLTDGEVKSPVWSFKIDSESEVIPGETDDNEIVDVGNLNISITTDIEKIQLKQGNETTFRINITNFDNDEINLAIVTSGDASHCLSLSNFISVQSNETITETVKVTRTSLLEPGNYTIALVFIHPDGMKHLRIPLWIQEGDEKVSEYPSENTTEKEKDDTTNGTIVTRTEQRSADDTLFYITIIGFFFFILVLAGVGFITNRRLKEKIAVLEKETIKEEVLEPESYSLPKPSFVPLGRDPNYIGESTSQVPSMSGPYSPQELPGRPFEQRIATFQSPTSGPDVVLPAAQPVSTEPLNNQSSEVSGISPAISMQIQPPPVSTSPPTITVQLPLVGGVVKEDEQKLLPQTSSSLPPPPA